MRTPGFLCCVFAAVLAGVSPSTATSIPTRANAVQLADTSADLPLGDGTALLMGGTSIPQPSQPYLDAADTLYLQPHGFTGTLQSLFTPENASPTSESRGEQILDSTILQNYNTEDLSAQNPVKSSVL